MMAVRPAATFEAENSQVDQSPTPPPLLSTAPVRRADRYAALVIISISLLGLVMILPYVDRPWPRLFAFIPAGDTGLALTYLITATLLMGQFVQLRAPSALVLSCGYFFACFIVIAHLLSDSQTLRALHPREANDLTTEWLFALWHSVFPIFVTSYALLSRSRYDEPVKRNRLLPMAGLSIAVALGLAAASVAVAISNLSLWPNLLHHNGDFITATAAIAWLISAVALAVLYARTRARRILDLWLCVVLFAWMLDITVGGLIGGAQYSFGWYAGRIYGVLAAGLILSALILETGSLYARLTRALAETNVQSAALFESEAALRQAQKMEAIGQITGGVAHDFNNLLTVIIGSLEMLKNEHGGDSRSARLTGYAMQAAVKGEKLTKQLLAFSRRQMLDPEVKDPNQLIRDFDGLMHRAMGETIRIVLDLMPGIGAVHVDPAQFESAILNLAVNARDAMGGTGVITIQTRAVPEGRSAAKSSELASGPYVMIAVSDTGMGMDADTVSRVFEPFFTTKPAGKGSGLGLSQVYGFVSSSRGLVEIESKPGAGTTVRLYLPRVAEDADFVPAPEPANRIPHAKTGEMILVVEDDPGVLAMAVEGLTELGYRVQTARSGPEALKLIRADQKIDLLFSDIVMPDGMNGVELSFEARAVRPTLDILLTSGYAAGALADTGRLPIGVEIIAKPYRLEDLALKVRQIVDGEHPALVDQPY
jgi:signal transduction histidine kinase/CheY-like chemotaxis protein